MRIRQNPTLAAAQALFARGEYEAAIEKLAPFLAARRRALSVRLKALAVAAAACAQLGRHKEEVKIREDRLGLLKKAAMNEAPERAALARALIALGRLDDAERALGPHDPAGDPGDRAEHLEAKATLLLRRSRDYEGAVEILREAYRLVDPAGTAFDRGRLNVRIGHALRFAGKIPEARKALADGQAELAKVLEEDPRAATELAKSEFYLGDTYRLSGEFKLALSFYDRAKALLGPRASVHFTKRYFQRIGAVHYYLEDFAKAREAYLHPECLAAIEKIGNPEDFFWSHLGAAKALIAEGSLAEAEQHFERARRAAGESPSAFMQGHLALARGALFQKRGAWDAAENNYREAERSFTAVGKSGHLPGIVDSIVSVGLLAVSRNQKDKAIASARRCGEVSAQSGFLAVQARELLLKSAVLAENDGDLDDLFKDVMDRLDAINCPATMYKVVANIYHYGRKLKDYEFDVELEARLARLRDALDRSVYDKLRRKYFDRRFAQRILDHLTGGSTKAEPD